MTAEVDPRTLEARRRPLDVAVLLPGIGVFGGIRRFIEIGNEFVRRGHRYTLYHPGGEPPDWLEFAGDVRKSEELRGAGHDVLMCNDPPLIPEFERARAALKIFYFALEGIADEARIARRRDWVIVANSTGLAKRLERRHGVAAERAIGGISLDTFHPPATSRPPGDPLRILAYGRLSRRRKGVPLVMKAVASFARGLARRRGPAVQLVLFDHVGTGNEDDPRASLRGPIQPEFHLNLSQPELADLYRGCDVFVSAERRAGWSNTVAEAMACGVPVVCTRSGTLDLAIHRETAWVVRWRHPFFISRGLAELQRDPAATVRMRDAALERVARFAWPHVADQLEDVILRRLG